MTIYDKLVDIQIKHPKLTFNNNGYEYIDTKSLSGEDLIAFNEVTNILKETIPEFVTFNNFKPSKNGIMLRMQTYWDSSFIGVEYIDIEFFKQFKNND